MAEVLLAVTAFCSQIKSMRKDMLCLQVLKVVMFATSALMTWNLLKLVFNNDNPVVVVLTGSMEPGFKRGDILLVSDNEYPLQTGDVVVYALEGKFIPIVHRLLDRRTLMLDGETTPVFITKGDNNNDYDTFLYTTGKQFLEREEIIGRILAYLPGLGYLTILMKEHPWVRNIFFAFLGALALLGHDE
eukprot:gnl/Dysnectes_brevis/2684_a3250_2338.p1 GENE.gnl/Dysnectes_brevis/2684_a3250_2338~~gnl/Dysnectes_brevis/2684_a3250_2338.p1  ORF type:complete len:188 (-),score=13.01 gnl/Dysnectes_brevis/2684_a3250_2338:40-603(-)